MKNSLETGSRNDDLTRQCCPLLTNTLPAFLKLSALFLYKEWKFLLELCQSRSPGLSVGVTVNMCFPRFTLLLCHTALCLCCYTGATTPLLRSLPLFVQMKTPVPYRGWRSRAEASPHPLVRTWEQWGAHGEVWLLWGSVPWPKSSNLPPGHCREGAARSWPRWSLSPHHARQDIRASPRPVGTSSAASASPSRRHG